MAYNIEIPINYYDTSRLKSVTEWTPEHLKNITTTALHDIETEYEVCGEVFHYGKGQYEIGSHYGINLHNAERICIIFSTQRDIAYPLAIFPQNNCRRAADYFVQLVSEGRASIK
jgi:hypothetical protein